MPKISVIIPTYNTERYIAEAIESVLQQTFSDFELIIVNDGSTDDTKKVIKKEMRQDKRIKFLDFKENRGKSFVLNRAIETANGEYICFLDADDIYFKDKLEHQIKFMTQHPEADMIYGGADYLGGNLEPDKTLVMPQDDFYGYLMESSKKTPEELRAQHHKILSDKEGIIAFGSVMIKKGVFDKCKFDENLSYTEDYDLWYQIVSKRFNIRSINKSFYYYRMHENQISRNKEFREKALAIVFDRISSGKYFEN